MLGSGSGPLRPSARVDLYKTGIDVHSSVKEVEPSLELLTIQLSPSASYPILTHRRRTKTEDQPRAVQAAQRIYHPESIPPLSIWPSQSAHLGVNLQSPDGISWLGLASSLGGFVVFGLRGGFGPELGMVSGY